MAIPASRLAPVDTPPPPNTILVVRRWEEQVKHGKLTQFTKDMAVRGITANTIDELVDLVRQRLKAHVYVVLPSPQEELLAKCQRYRDFQGSLGGNSTANSHK